MKKKLIGLLLAGAMVFALAGCGNKSASTEGSTSGQNDAKSTASTASTGSETASTGSETASTGSETASTGSAGSQEVAEEKPVEGGQVIIGDGTQSNGDIYPYWSNNSSDARVYDLTFGQGTVETNQRGEFVLSNTVVKDMQKVVNEDGTATYTFKLSDALKWSNGEKITAKDFAFHLLYFASPEIIKIGAADNSAGSRFVGFDEYNSGKSKVFKGVRLLGDHEISVTVKKDYVPFFYELALVSIIPSYMKDWVPEGVDVADDGEGIYFKGDFSEKSIKAIQDKGGRLKLTAYSGPYMKDSYDETSNTYTLKRNPEYPGNFEGHKPYIDTIIYKYVQNETQIDELATGGVDILVQLGGANEINSALDLAAKGTHAFVSYPRSGFGKLVFKCDRGPTRFVEVRHAIAYLLDRNDFAKTFTGGHGSVVNGAYGLSQWMVEDREEEIAALNQYSYSVENAVAELEKGGWVLGKDGKEYKSGVRYKKLDDGKLIPLKIEWCASENNPVSDLLATKLANSEDVKKVGFEIKQSTVTFNELINNYYDLKENDFNMFNMGTGFTPLYDMEQSYKIDGPQNNNKISDEELAKLGKAMNAVDPADTEKYLDNFVAFQKRWNELLPDLPLYSNEYHDAFSARLKGYTGIKDSLWNFASQILYSWIQD